MNIKDSAKIMALLEAGYASHYNKLTADNKSDMVKLWASLFANYDYTLVEGAVKAYIVNDKLGFPPVPGQIMENIRKITNPQGKSMTDEEAWQLVKKAISNGNYNAEEEFNNLPKVLQRAVGSPQMIKNYAMCTHKEMQYAKKDIMDSYREAKEQEEFKKLNDIVGIESSKMRIEELPFYDEK